MAQKDYALEHTKPIFNKYNLLNLHNLNVYRSLVTYFGYFGCVYPRSRKGHQISDHLDGE